MFKLTLTILADLLIKLLYPNHLEYELDMIHIDLISGSSDFTD